LRAPASVRASRSAPRTAFGQARGSSGISPDARTSPAARRALGAKSVEAGHTVGDVAGQRQPIGNAGRLDAARRTNPSSSIMRCACGHLHHALPTMH